MGLTLGDLRTAGWKRWEIGGEGAGGFSRIGAEPGA